MDLYVGEPSVRNDKDPNQSPFERLVQLKTAKDEALANLKSKLTPFFAQFSLEKNYYEQQGLDAEDQSLKLFDIKPFGSTCFDAIDESSDIDCVLLSLKGVLNRQEFFSKFVSSLRLVGAKIVQEITKAKIPVIKF